MFNFSNIILEKNRVERAIASGQVTGNNINTVLNSGGARGLQTHLSGLEKGTTNIINQRRLSEKNGILGSVFPHQNGIELHIPKSRKGSIIGRFVNTKSEGVRGFFRGTKSLTPIIRRHEVDEYRDKGRGVNFRHNNKVVGQHASPKVLQREYDHVSYLSKLDPSINNFKKIRDNNNEYSPKLLSLNSSKLRKLRQKSKEHNSKRALQIENNNERIRKDLYLKSGIKSKFLALKNGMKRAKILNKYLYFNFDLDK